MKIEASDCESEAAPSQQQQQQTTTITTSLNNNENDANKSSAAEAATTPTSTKITKMTDERNTSTNNNNNNNNKNINNDGIVEAAKILLKNGLNGANTAVSATLLSAAATAAVATAKEINLPPPPPPLPISIHTINNGLSSATLRTTSTNQQQFSTAPTTTKAMAAATATSTANEFLSTAEHIVATTPPITALGAGGASTGVKVDNGGVIDYTVNANSTPIALTTASSNNKKIPSNNDICRHASVTSAGGASRGQNFGGRLQFFKDGKFILELARSKDGEKGGWVSVPRKLFRAPASATSSTITPTSTSSTTYPKNESSTSLSFSDDNSSIQSSPWQRDHCWKQSAPRHGISKELSHYYQRPNRFKLSAIGLLASRKKRRRPFDCTITPNWVKTFTPLEQGGGKNSSDAATKARSQHDCGNNTEDDASSSSSTSTLTGADCVVGANLTTTPTPILLSAELSSDESTKIDTKIRKCDVRNSEKDSVNIGNTDSERMNTSEDDQDADVSMAVSNLAAEGESSSKDKLNGDLQVDNGAMLDLTPPSQPPKTIEIATSKEKDAVAETGAREKRLKQLKTRAKLRTIIQKLIDRVPTVDLLFTSKTPQLMSGNGGSATFKQSNSMAHKISPPSSSSSASTSRLVELQYHQQHVSPRKRILREFEKVSLEDTGPTAAGGKRSRAKGNATAPKSSPQRVQSTGCAVLTSTSTTTATTTATNGSFNKNAAKPAPLPGPPVSSTPTRLYSSYSIHSLLGGGNSSSSNATATSTATSKLVNEQAIINNMNYQQLQHQQQQHHFTDPSYLRAMLASPKSPENNIGGTLCGGKSPSSNSTNKKRSPPYTSPLYDNHSRSPIVSTHVSNDYGRRSPRSTPPESNYKIRFAADNSTAAQSNSSSHLQQQHAPHQSFYSPYTKSPKYVPAPQTSMSPNSSINSNAARSPRHSSFSAHIPTSNASSANSIPTRELSPPRSATASPRETTPRTVPKKTASIRRQFASPTSSAMSSDRADVLHHERKTHLNTSSAGTAHQQQSYQQASKNSHVAALTPAGASPLHYYMYAQNAVGPSSSNAGSGTSVAAAVAAAAAAYIPTAIPPSYYHPYISTLAALRHNPMWMHYPGTSPAGMPPQHQAASRLSSPFHNFPYNGVGAAAVAAAASAFGGPMTSSSHMSQVLNHQMSAPSAIHHPAYGRASIHSPKLTDENSMHTTKQTTATSIYPSSNSDEHSSDVPLNLSKH